MGKRLHTKFYFALLLGLIYSGIAFSQTITNEYCFDTAILGGGAENTGQHIGHLDRPSSYAEWIVDGGVGGMASITVTYATAVASPSLGISVNDGAATNHPISPTGNWDGVYPGSFTFTANLNAGNDNRVRFTTPTGGVNIRCITVVAPGAEITCDVVILTQPQGREYTQGSRPSAESISVVASGTALSFQWYRSADNSNTTPENDTPIGRNASSFTPDISRAGTAYYFVRVSNIACEVVSNVISVVVQPSSGATFPEGYPMTMRMPQNPLFWQFPALMVSDDDAGTIIPGRVGNFFSADPSARVFNIDGVETLFVYASQDMVHGRGCDRMDRYHVFSTTDMIYWTNHGEIFNASHVPWSRDNYFSNGSTFMWAPDAIQGPSGRFYFYFPHPMQNDGIDGSPNNWNNQWQIGIAVSDHPASNFTILPEPMQGLGIAEGVIDPHVFIDNSGQAFFYVGGGGRAFGGRLNPDMISIDGEMIEMEGLVDFHEAIWVHYYNGRYFMSHSDNGGGGSNHGDRMVYAVSDHPLGPWTNMGVFINATGNGTIHGSIVEFNGQWYAFYHSDHISNGGEPAGRSVHFDRLFHNPDGTIQLVNTHGMPFGGETRTVRATETTTEIALVLEAEHFNEVPGAIDGGPTYGYHDRNMTVRDATGLRTGLSPILSVYRPVRGMIIQAMSSASNDHSIGDLENKEFMRYTIYVEEAGLYDIDVFVASENSGGRFQLHTNGINRTGLINVASTGSWTTFASITARNLPLVAGENLFEFRVDNGGFNIDRFEFRAAEPYTGTPFFGQPINVPGRVEAEHYDRGCQGVAFFDTDGPRPGFDTFRTDCVGQGNIVDLEVSGDRVNIAWTSNGEWTNYTIYVTETGIYDITVRVATGNNAPGSLFLTFNGTEEFPLMTTTTASWTTYTDMIQRGVPLTAGVNIMRMTIGSNINVDYFYFVRVDDLPTDIYVPTISDSQIILYPNPTTGIAYLNKYADIRVYDLQGVLLLSTSGRKIDLTGRNPGVYIAVIRFENQTRQMKLIKR